MMTDMRCNRCGEEIKTGKDSMFEVAYLPTFDAIGPRDRPTILSLCGECANRRRATQKVFLWVFVLTVGAMTAAAIVQHYLPR
jgi:hypothetical protein